METVRRICLHQENAAYGERTRLVFSEAKTESSKRTLYLPEVLMALFSRQYRRFTELFQREPGPDDFIFFNSKGGVTDPDNLSHYFGNVLEGLGLPHFKYHALRHSCATIMLYLGYTLKDIQTWLGHSNYNFTADTYIHSGIGVHEQMAKTLSENLSALLPENAVFSENIQQC